MEMVGKHDLQPCLYCELIKIPMWIGHFVHLSLTVGTLLIEIFKWKSSQQFRYNMILNSFKNSCQWRRCCGKPNTVITAKKEVVNIWRTWRITLFAFWIYQEFDLMQILLFINLWQLERGRLETSRKNQAG